GGGDWGGLSAGCGAGGGGRLGFWGVTFLRSVSKRSFCPPASWARNSRHMNWASRSGGRGTTILRRSSCISAASEYRRSRSFARELEMMGSNGAEFGSYSEGGGGSYRCTDSSVSTMLLLWKGFTPESIS